MEDWWLTLWVGYFGIGLYPKIYGRIQHILFVVESQGIHANYDGKFFLKYWRCLETAKYPLIIMNYCFLLSLQLLRLNFSKVLRVVIKGGERSVHLAILSGKNPLSPMSIWFLTKYLTACQSLPSNAPFAFKIQFLQSNFPVKRLSLTNELGCLKNCLLLFFCT